MRNLTLQARARNLLRTAGLEIVPAKVESNLLALHLMKLFSEYEISWVLDVGAHQGGYAQWLRRNGYRGNIVSFEPIRANFEVLTTAAADDLAWHCFNYALGSEDKTAELNVTSLTVFSSFHEPNSTAKAIFGQTPAVERLEKVQVHRLDTLLDSLPVEVGKDKLYLKLDTQGWDLEVIAGAQGVLDRIIALQTEAAIQTIYEGMPAISDSLAALTERGFVPSGFFPVSFDKGLGLVEVDLVAVRAADYGVSAVAGG